MTDADCTPGREPRSVAASLLSYLLTLLARAIRRRGRFARSRRRCRGAATKVKAVTTIPLSAIPPTYWIPRLRAMVVPTASPFDLGHRAIIECRWLLLPCRSVVSAAAARDRPAAAVGRSHHVDQHSRCPGSSFLAANNT